MKRKVYWYWAWTSDNLPETFIQEIPRFDEQLAELKWITFFLGKSLYDGMNYVDVVNNAPTENK